MLLSLVNTNDAEIDRQHEEIGKLLVGLEEDEKNAVTLGDRIKHLEIKLKEHSNYEFQILSRGNYNNRVRHLQEHVFLIKTFAMEMGNHNRKIVNKKGLNRFAALWCKHLNEDAEIINKMKAANSA